MDDEYRVISSEDFDDASADLSVNGTVFRYCDFTGLMRDGGGIDATFVGGSFKECEFYWTLFNMCLVVDMRFERCVFRGVSFPGCRFLNCRFIDCSFVADVTVGSAVSRKPVGMTLSFRGVRGLLLSCPRLF